MRNDLYSAIHKAQRYHLCRLAEEMGRTDLADLASIDRVCTELRLLIEHLRDHARNESKYIHPLFAALGRGAASLDQDHDLLEVELAGLERIMAERCWSKLYPAYAAFLGKYLTHAADEEQLQADVLWVHYRDEELAAVFNRFKTERSAEASKQDLAFLLPALSLPELTRMYRGMKAAAPPAAFRNACQLAEEKLGAPRWEQLAQALV